MRLPKFLTRLLYFLLIIVGSLFMSFSVRADSPTPSPSTSPTPTGTSSDVSQSEGALQDKINEYQQKISDLKGQEQSLSSEIDTMDSQIAITQYRMTLTQEQITNVEMDIDTAKNKIAILESSLSGLTKVLLSRIVATYEVGSVQPLQILASSNSVDDFFTRANYLKIAQAHDKQLIYDTQQAKNDYANQEAILVAQQKRIQDLESQLKDYSKQLDTQKASKQSLLTQTQGSEETYQRLLSEAKAQLASFQNFVRVQGGASILSGQTDCSNSWGCYYNQRDSQWGNIGINQTSTSIAEAGCLMTSMAMVISHYGHKVTPLDVNAPGNFFSSTAYLLYTISVGGVSAQRTSAAIDATLNDSKNDPVIVGVSYDGGPIPDHFVVLVSGSNGSYLMNDPFTPSGNHISFTSKYTVGSIREIDRVTIL